MGRNRVVQAAAATAVLFLYPALVSAGAYSLTVAGERLEFVPQPEKGYVIRLAEKAGVIHAMAGLSALDGEDTRPIRGLGRRGVWTVENDGPAGRNEGTIRVLRARGQAAYAAPLFASGGETVAIIPEIVVRVKPGIEIEEVQTLCEVAGCTIRKRMEFTEQEYLLEVLGPDAEAVFAAVEQLSQAPEVEWVCPNTACRPRLPHPAGMVEPVPGGQLRIAAAGEGPNSAGVFPNDEYFPNQWHLHNTGQSGGTPGADIRAPEAWEITTGDPNVIIAVVDGGVDSSHPDLIGNLVPGYDFYEGDAVPDPARDSPGDAHGTACAGLAAARGGNGIGIAGVAYNCKIMPIRIHSSQGGSTAADKATAIRWAASNGADILSNSWGQLTETEIIHSAVKDVTVLGGIGRAGKGCAALWAVDILGGKINGADQAAYAESIAVGAADHSDARIGYSDYGPELDIMGLSRPFTDSGTVWTTDIIGFAGFNSRKPDIPDYTDEFAGTSAACPIAAGVAALILSIEPDLTSDEVRYFLERSAKDLGTPGRDDYYGWGRVDARAALDMVLAKRADLNNDWKVDEEDEAILLGAIEVNDLSADIAPAARRDGVVDEQDLELLTRYLGTVMPELGLTAHWKFDETQGLIASDSAGKNNAAVIGGAVWQPGGGKIGGALQLTGVANFISAKLARNPSQGPMSVLVWVKGGGPGQVILSQAGVANWLMANALDGALMTDLKESGRNGIALLSQTVITDGAWHRVGLVWDASNRILYVDDFEVARDTQSALAGSAANLTIGAGSTFAPGTYWSGLIDDVRLYDRAVKP